MSNAISRRTFLKCAGAATVAVGAASMLGGCSLIDDALNKVMDANGVSGVTINGVGVQCDFGFQLHEREGEADFGNIAAVAMDVSFSSVSSKAWTIKASDFELTVDGKKATTLYGEEAKKVYSTTDERTYMPFDKNGQIRLGTEAAESARYKGGLVVFKLAEVVENWKDMKLKIKVADGEANFTVTLHTSDSNVLDAKANR